MNCWSGIPQASRVGTGALVSLLAAIVAVWFDIHPPNFAQRLASVALVGEGVFDMRTLAIPSKMTPGEYQWAAGLCPLAALKRLPAEDGTGSPLVDKATLLGSARVEDPLGGVHNEP